MLTTLSDRILKRLRRVWEMQRDYDIAYPCNERLDESFNDTKWFKSCFRAVLYKMKCEWTFEKHK